MQKPSDRWFFLVWGCFALAVVLSRKLYIGDGIRHVSYVVAHSAPALGEARWLLFPTFLFALLRPLLALGIVDSVEGALVPFGLASVTASLIYLGALRSWLIDQEVENDKRWIALGLAALCPATLLYATDTAEPLFAATLCAVGLAVISRTQRLAAGILCMSLGLLLHQAVFVAFFLLPLACSWQKLRDLRELRRTALIVGAVVSAILTILIVAHGISLGDALERIFTVYRNTTHANWMRGGLLKGLVVTLFGGFPQALVIVPNNSGMRAMIFGLGQGDMQAIGQVLRLLLGFTLVSAGAYLGYRRRRWEWFVALAGFSILPIIWNNLYGYPKFYVLFPLLAAHVVARAGSRVGIASVALLALVNVSALLEDLQHGREKVGAREAAYRQATEKTRWITSGWGPDPPYLWPGPHCGMLKSLGQPSNAKTVEALRDERTGEFVGCVREAFCSDGPVWTDDWVAWNGTIRSIADAHRLPMKDLEKSFWRGPTDGKARDPNPQHPLYVFSNERQAEICRDLGGPASP